MRATLTRLPDSTLCRDALELATELEPEFLFNHSLRTFLFGRLIGEAEGTAVDEELLFVAGVLHDIGLTDRFNGDQRFEVEGADAARAVCLDHGVEDRRADLVWDAIALHTSSGIPTRKGPEVALLHLGAGADLVGSGLEAVAAADVEAVLAAHPRLDVDRRFFPHVAEQIAANPRKAPPFTLPAEIARSHIPGYRPTALADVLAESAFAANRGPASKR